MRKVSYFLVSLALASSARAAVLQGQVWVNLGPADGTQVGPQAQLSADSGRVRRIVPHPADADILYLATAGGGVWKSFDAQTAISATTGPHWLSITQGLEQSIGAFALDPTTPDNLYVGLGDPFGVPGGSVVTSSDGGITWSTPAALGSATSVREILVDPANTGVVLAATDAGLFRSSTAGLGASWTAIALGNANICISAWSIAYVGAHTWLATCQGTSYGSVWRSADDGVSWNEAALPSLEVPDLGRMTLAAAAGDSGNPGAAWVYLAAADAAGDDQKDLFLSRDGGASFQSLNMVGSATCQPTCATPTYWTADQPDLDAMHARAWEDQALAVDPRNHLDVYLGGDAALLASSDGGVTWSVFTDRAPSATGNTDVPYVHSDWQTIAIALTGSTPYFYAGTGGGIFRSSDVFGAAPSSNPDAACYHGSCVHFDYALGRGLVTHLARGLAMDLHDANNATLLGGLEDDGARLRVLTAGVAATTFNQMTGGDGAGVGIGISTSSAAPVSCRGSWGSLLIATLSAGIYRSLDCGASFSPAMNGICSPTLFGSNDSCGMDAKSNRFMLLASDRADASGQIFFTAVNRSACSAGSSSCTVQSGANNVYASHDGAGSWVKASGNVHLAGGIAGQFPDPLVFAAANPLAAGIWAVAGGDFVYVSVDSGADWVQSAALPAAATSASFGSADGHALWATAGQRVYKSADSGAHWNDATGSLPEAAANVAVAAPDDPATAYLGNSLGVYVTHDAQDASPQWQRLGLGLPNVSVTALDVTLDSAVIRIATYGRGFWELSASSSAPAGVYGSGDFDHNQIVDGFDLVREAAALGTSPADADFDETANLAGSTNWIDYADFSALVQKLGGRP